MSKAAASTSRGLRLTLRSVLVVLALSALVAACGSKDTSSAQIKAEIQAFLGKVAQGKSHEACSYLTASGRHQLIELVAHQRGGTLPKAKTCDTAAGIAHAAAGKALLDALRTATVSDVHVHGDTATARVSNGNKFPPQQLSLERKSKHSLARRWLISATTPGGG
jgi:hypothetical protein